MTERTSEIILHHRFLSDAFASLLEDNEALVLEEMAGLILTGELDMNRPFADLIGVNYTRLKRFVYCRRHGLPYPLLRKWSAADESELSIGYAS